jgi:hypothetical protein
VNEYAALSSHHTVTAYPVTTKTVAASGGDYTTIKAAVAAVSPTRIAPVKIFVKNGTYQEIQVIGKDWLTIEGESRAGVIIVSNGLRTDVDPVSGQRYVDMAQDDKSGFFTTYQMVFRNLTMQVNDVKYCCHADLTGTWDLLFENCQIEHANGYPIGVGARVNENITFINCTFKKTGANAANGVAGSHGVYWHNWNNQPGMAKLTLINCNAVNCGLVLAYELGSAQKDLIRIENCSTDDKVNNLVVTETYYTPPGTAAQVPYCIQQLIINSPTVYPVTNSDSNRSAMASSIYAV